MKHTIPQAMKAAWNNEQMPALTRWLYLVSILCTFTALAMLFWPAHLPHLQVWIVGLVLAFAGLGYHVWRIWHE